MCALKPGTCAPNPSAPIPIPIPPPKDAVEETVVEKRKPTTAPNRVAALPEPVVPRSGTVYGCGEKYTWLIGKLRRVHVPGGDWKTRFLELYKVDRWGGSMVLAPDIRLEDFSDGDSV